MRYLFTVLFLILTTGPAWSAPQVVAEVLEYDFGEVVQGDKVDYTFRFRNAGDELLMIGSVHSSCGCTAALLSSKQIAPGDMGEIKTTFDSNNFRNSIHKTITIETNDPDNATVRFQLKGVVKEELILNPTRLSFGKLAPGQQVEQLVGITNSSKETVTLQEPRVTNQNLQATLGSASLAPGEKTELKVTARVPEDAERLSGYVMIGTSYGKVPNLRLSVSASVSR
ncbi:MAG TPA: DUF1573 domain-containing protein [Geopsychrobacteraceae bacterium]|nr:DUF1573 domain-containing protein [Geopsychrobacteraceae bacterium]